MGRLKLCGLGLRLGNFAILGERLNHLQATVIGVLDGARLRPFLKFFLGGAGFFCV